MHWHILKFLKMSVNVSNICGNMVSSKKEKESTLPDGRVLFLRNKTPELKVVKWRIMKT